MCANTHIHEQVIEICGGGVGGGGVGGIKYDDCVGFPNSAVPVVYAGQLQRIIGVCVCA